MNASPQKDGMKVISLSGSQRSDDSFMSVGTKAVVGQQRVEIERLQAELARGLNLIMSLGWSPPPPGSEGPMT